MPTLADIRAAIKTKLAAVSDVGQVHDFERYVKEASKLSSLYVSGGRVKGAFVAWRSQETSSPGEGRYAVTNRWEIRLFRSLDDGDATEKAFDTLVDTARQAFQADENLGGVISSLVIGGDQDTGPAGLQVRDKSAVLFCGVLCHQARCELFTRHYE